MNTAIIRNLSIFFPRMVASFAYSQLTNPQIKKLREHENLVLDKATQHDMDFRGFNIKWYEWGKGDKAVLLIHGWEGQAGNFADLVEKLLKKNHKIYAFDAPSHGYSSKGKTSLFEFTELVGVLIRKFGVKTLISHSFGGVATTFALYQNPDLKIDKYLLLTTPDRFIERINDVSQTIGITDKVKDLLIQRLNHETQQDVLALNVSDFVQHVRVKKAMIFHDRDDKVIPIERSMNVYENWPAAKFVEVTGTGHFRILRDQAVLGSVVEFLEG